MPANMKTTVNKDKLTIEVDLSQDFGKSKSGKTIIIASSYGAELVPHEKGVVSVNLNVYRK